MPPWEIPDSSPVFTFSPEPVVRSETKSVAWAVSRAAQSSSSVASGRPKRKFSATVPENR